MKKCDWKGPHIAEAQAIILKSPLFRLKDLMFEHIDYLLISTFVERQQPDTNTFHMIFGEMTITFHDV